MGIEEKCEEQECREYAELSAKERVEFELEELKERIAKLSLFLFSKEIIENEKISLHMRSLMKDQLSAMQEYASILQKRLRIWDKTDEELIKGEIVCY